MNLKEIKEMLDLMNEHELAEIEVEKEGLKLRLKKQPRGEIQVVKEVLAEGPRVIAKHEIPAREAIPDNLIEIKSPMVGTFYRASSPEASPFTDIGQELEVGQIICIIEAMKLMNEIKSEVVGKVKRILVENGEPVEFGQVLFLVESI